MSLLYLLVILTIDKKELKMNISKKIYNLWASPNTDMVYIHFHLYIIYLLLSFKLYSFKIRIHLISLFAEYLMILLSYRTHEYD